MPRTRTQRAVAPTRRRVLPCWWCGELGCKGTCPGARAANAKAAARFQEDLAAGQESEAARQGREIVRLYFSGDPETRERLARDLFG